MSNTFRGNERDDNKQSFVADGQGNSARNVVSYNMEQLLSQILSALGGSANTTATVFNVDCAIAGTEYSQALPSNTKKFSIKARGNSKIDFYYSSGASDTWTLFPGNSFDDVNFYSSQTIYFKCSKADEVVEIVAYV